MIIDILKALLFAGVPIALFSYYLVVLTHRSTKPKSNNSLELKLELKGVSLDDKDGSSGINDQADNDEESFFVKILRKKSVAFGGGFYGIVALMTYLHVEFYQVIDFLKNFISVADFIDSIGFKMLINFFIEALMNLITAFVWPVYWMKILPIGSLWIWVIIAFLSYWFATKYALSQNRN